MPNTGAEVGVNLHLVSGLPETGKSTLSEEVGRALRLPVFAFDWLMGALMPFRDPVGRKLLPVSDAILPMLVRRQFLLSPSAILDYPAYTADACPG